MFTAPEVQATIPRMRRIGILAALTLVACGETKTEIVTVPGEWADGSVDADPEGSVEGGADSTSEVATDGAIDTTTPPDGADAATDAATDGSDGGPGCTLKEGGDLCTKVPKFVGTQVVDGSDAEFCDLEATVVAVKGGTPPPGYGVTTNPSLPTKLIVAICKLEHWNLPRTLGLPTSYERQGWRRVLTRDWVDDAQLSHYSTSRQSA